MKIKQLGNGSAFNTDMTNTSFLIDLNITYLLFDCGYSVFKELKDQEKNGLDLTKLQYVYISHMDDDHMGSLKSLIFYMFFVNNIKLNILFPENIELDEYLKDMKNYCNLEPMWGIHTLGKYNLELVPTKHHVTCYGLLISDILTGEESVYFTGDTCICDSVINIVNETFECENFRIYHDSSSFEGEDRVHASFFDIENTYNEDVKKRLVLVHNDEPFYCGWVTI